MTEQLVKTYWVTGALGFVRSHYPKDVSERVIAGLPDDIKASLSQRDRTHWTPRAYHVGVMNAIASTQRDEAGAYDDLLAYGQHVGAEAASGSLKTFLPIVNLKLFAKKLPALWTREHQDDSRLETDIVALDESRLPFRLMMIRGYDHVGVAQLGWLKAVMSRVIRKPLQVKQAGWSLSRPGPNEIVGEVSW